MLGAGPAHAHVKAAIHQATVLPATVVSNKVVSCMIHCCAVACCRQLLSTNRPPAYFFATVAEIKRTDTYMTSGNTSSTPCVVVCVQWRRNKCEWALSKNYQCLWNCYCQQEICMVSLYVATCRDEMFRRVLSQVEVCSLIPRGVSRVALTATATLKPWAEVT